MIEIGLERCVNHPPAVLDGARFGLLMNQASVNREFRYACDVLSERFPSKLVTLFSPQHGLWSEQQANMIETPHGWYEPLNVPLYSLYSYTRRPSREMLDKLDCLVIDLQDVGTRVYTFIWTVTHCLEVCSDAGIPVVILDRPNPVGGEIVEGPILDPAFASFVGRAAIPMRHTMTLGELTLWANDALRIHANVEVVTMSGWQRSMLFPETGRQFVLPSPNMPRVETAMLYPGQVMLEGTNLSEGRGTTIPFEVIGAPFIDPHQLLHDLAGQPFPGLALRPVRFVPTFDKWQGQSCGGVSLHIVDALAVRSFRATVAIVTAIRKRWPKEFQWLPPPYEYETVKMPIDILYGSAKFREALEQPDAMTPAGINDLAHVDIEAWSRSTAAFRLYE